jgi:HEAT repeat protein
MLNTMRLLLFAFAFTIPTFAQQPPIDHAWEILNGGLHDGNPLRRVQDVSAMGIMRPHPKSVALVESAFDDKDYSVRQAACIALEQMKSKQSIPKLHDALNDKAPEVIFAAAKALYSMGDPMGREVLVAIILGDQADSSKFFASSIHDLRAKMHDPKAMALISVKEGAGIFLGPAGAGVGVAEGLMKDANASGKTVAVALLAKDMQPETLTAIRQALGDKNWTVRAAAARALALADKTETFNDIAALLNDVRTEVQYSAAAAAIRLKQPLVAPRQTKAAPQTNTAPKK